MSEMQSLKNRKAIFETLRNPKRVSGAPKIPKEFFSEPKTQSVSQFISEHTDSRCMCQLSILTIHRIVDFCCLKGL